MCCNIQHQVFEAKHAVMGITFKNVMMNFLGQIPHLPVNLWCRLPQSSTEFHLPCHAFWMVSHRSCTKCWPKVRPWFPAWMQVVAWCATDAVSWPMWPSGRINGVVPRESATGEMGLRIHYQNSSGGGDANAHGK